MQTSQRRPLSTVSLLLLLIPFVLVPLTTLVLAPLLTDGGLEVVPATVLAQAVLWGLALLLLAGVRWIEQRPLSSIGWTRPKTIWIVQALVLGVLLSLLVPALTMLVSAVLPAAQEGSIEAATTTIPVWLLFLSVVTAAVTEEIFFRGYAIERLLEWSGSPWLSGLISLAFFVLVHASGWNLTHIVGVVLPLGLILTALYLWRRNVFFVMIVHFMINLPLVFLGAMG